MSVLAAAITLQIITLLLCYVVACKDCHLAELSLVLAVLMAEMCSNV